MALFFDMIQKFYQQNFILSLYLIIILIILVMEIMFLIKSNWIIYKLNKKLNRRNFKTDDTLTQIKKEYEKKLKVTTANIDIYTFIKSNLENKKKKLFRGIMFIENSASLYILLGFLGAVFITANAFLSIKFTGLESLDIIYSKLDNIIITIIFTLVCSIVIKITSYVFNTEENIDSLIENIKEYLETEIMPYSYNRSGEVQAIRELMEKTEEKLLDIEKTIYKGLKEISSVIEKNNYDINNKNNNFIKILHTADIHAGLKFGELPEKKRKILSEARYEVLERLINTANKEKCNLFVIAGDLFESIKMNKEDIIRVVDVLNGFRGEAVLVLPGNHDYYSEELSRESNIWPTFQDYVTENVILLNEYKPYKLNNFGLDATIYPAYCDREDSKKNRLDWIKDLKIRDKNLWHIGIAHGAVQGKYFDMTTNYFVMNEEELKNIDMDLWLLGHTHEPYPEPGVINNTKLFNPGTPEPDSKRRKHYGNAWLITIDKNKYITAEGLKTGKYKYFLNKSET